MKDKRREMIKKTMIMMRWEKKNVETNRMRERERGGGEG